MIIDTSNALAAPGSSRGYACLSVACRSIAPGVRLRPPRGARLGVSSQGPAGPYVPPSADPAAPALLFRPAPPPRSPVTAGGCRGKGARLAQLGGRGAAAREWEKGREGAGSGRVPVAAAAAAGVVIVARVPSSGAPSRRTRFRGLGCVRSFVRWPGPGGRSPRRRRSSVGEGRVLGGRAGVARKRGARSGRRGSPSAPGGGPASGRPPLPVDRPPHVRRRARPSSPRRPSPPRARACVWGPKPARRPARPRSWPRSRGCVPRTVTRGTPRGRPPVARLPPVRGRVVPRGAPPWASASGRGGAAASPRPSRASRGGASCGVARRGVRPVPGSCSSLRSPRSGGAAGAPSAAALSRASPRRARLLLLPSETRPQIRRGDPLNLSILVSGGKETNQDSLSNGE